MGGGCSNADGLAFAGRVLVGVLQEEVEAPRQNAALERFGGRAKEWLGFRETGEED